MPPATTGWAIACAAGLFLVFHAAGRLGEALLASAALGPVAAAFVPAAAVLILFVAMIAAARLPAPWLARGRREHPLFK